jgi:hypothetical protein
VLEDLCGISMGLAPDRLLPGYIALSAYLRLSPF